MLWRTRASVQEIVKHRTYYNDELAASETSAPQRFDDRAKAEMRCYRVGLAVSKNVDDELASIRPSNDSGTELNSHTSAVVVFVLVRTANRRFGFLKTEINT